MPMRTYNGERSSTPIRVSYDEMKPKIFEEARRKGKEMLKKMKLLD
jgi:hypothetical protein